MKKTIHKFFLILALIVFAFSITGCSNYNKEDGLSAYEIYKKYYEYEGTEKDWIDDLVNGNLISYTVTFDGNGGKYVSGQLKQKVKHNQAAVAPVFKKDGYILSWDKDFDNVKVDTKVTAIWTRENEELYNNLFAKIDADYNYNDYFDFCLDNPNFSYELGSVENEQIFKRILNGKEDYRDFFEWFVNNPDYIYRYNEEALKCVEMVLQEGIFSDAIKDKYWGVYANIKSSHPYLPAMGKNGEHYQIYFNEDWSVKYVWQSIIYDGRQNSGFDLWHYCLPGYVLGFWQYNEVNEIKQLDRHLTAIYDDNDEFIGYYLSHSNLSIEVDMGDRTIDCSVLASYKLDISEQTIWLPQQKEYKNINTLSFCRINIDFNGVYSKGEHWMFDTYYFFTDEKGTWNLNKVWELFKESALVANKQKEDEKVQIIIY